MEFKVGSRVRDCDNLEYKGTVIVIRDNDVKIAWDNQTAYDARDNSFWPQDGFILEEALDHITSRTKTVNIIEYLEFIIRQSR